MSGGWRDTLSLTAELTLGASYHSSERLLADPSKSTSQLSRELNSTRRIGLDPVFLPSRAAPYRK